MQVTIRLSKTELKELLIDKLYAAKNVMDDAPRDLSEVEMDLDQYCAEAAVTLRYTEPQ